MNARPGDRRTGTAVITVLATLYTGAVAWLTLRPLPWATQGAQEHLGVLNPAAWTDTSAWVAGSAAEVLVNVLMFVPIGSASWFLARNAVIKVAAPLMVTLAIEVAQIPLEGRISHPRDLVANALGAALGLAIAAVGARIRVTLRDQR